MGNESKRDAGNEVPGWRMAGCLKMAFGYKIIIRGIYRRSGKDFHRPRLTRRASERQGDIIVRGKERKRFLRYVPAAILVSVEFQPILIIEILDVALIFLRHGIDHPGEDLQVFVSDDYRNLVQFSTPPENRDVERTF